MAGVNSNYVETDDSSIMDSEYTGGRNYFGLGLGNISETDIDNHGLLIIIPWTSNL